MTVRQEAHGMIDRMPEESVRALIPVMARLISFSQRQPAKKPDAISPRMQAFLEMQELRKGSVKYDFSEARREEAMTEKFGNIDWRPDNENPD